MKIHPNDLFEMKSDFLFPSDVYSDFSPMPCPLSSVLTTHFLPRSGRTTPVLSELLARHGIIRDLDLKYVVIVDVDGELHITASCYAHERREMTELLAAAAHAEGWADENGCVDLEAMATILPDTARYLMTDEEVAEWYRKVAAQRAAESETPSRAEVEEDDDDRPRDVPWVYRMSLMSEEQLLQCDENIRRFFRKPNVE